MTQAHRHSVRERSASSSMQNLELDEESMMAALCALDKECIATAGERVFFGCVDFASRVRGGESQIRASGEAVHARQGQ